VTVLTRHFTLEEFIRPEDRPAPAATRRFYLELCRDYLEPLRAAFGPTAVFSGYRSPSRNALVGGAPQSYHMRLPMRAGAAADVGCARGRPREWFALLDDLGAPGLGLYAAHVHVDNRRGHARW